MNHDERCAILGDHTSLMWYCERCGARESAEGVMTRAEAAEARIMELQAEVSALRADQVVMRDLCNLAIVRIDCPHVHGFPGVASNAANECCEKETLFRRAVEAYRASQPSMKEGR